MKTFDRDRPTRALRSRSSLESFVWIASFVLFVPAAHSAPPQRNELCRSLAQTSNPYFGTAAVPELTTDSTPEQRLHAARIHLESGRFEAATESLSPLLVDGAPAPHRTQAHWLAGLTQLRQGEARNCLGHASHGQDERDLCLLPLRPGALHRDPAPAAKAVDHLLAVLEARPRDAMAAWLLNLAAHLGRTPQKVPSRYRAPAMAPMSGQAPRFINRAPELGVDVEDLAGGAVIEDFDGDGRLDLLTSTWDPCGGLRAFRNEGPNGFVDVTERWGLGQIAGGLNLVTADLDGDRRVDVLVTRGAWLLGDGAIASSLLRNEPAADGGVLFRDVSDTVGLGAQSPAPTQAAVFADFDLDGDLDLYLAHEATAAHPFPSRLLRNDGIRFGGHGEIEGPGLVDVTDQAGVANLRFAKAVHVGDIDNDGDPDLYVSNFGLNRLYLNQWTETGKLHFVDRARELGVSEPAVESFSSWFFDADNDGDLDLLVTDYGRKAARIAASYFNPDSWIGRTLESDEGRPLFYRNLLVEWGHLGFEEVGDQLGLRRPAMPMGANFADLDNNGELDLYLGTGEPDLASQFPNQTFLQKDSSFVDATLDLGLGHLQKGHGVAFGDIDQDGDVDLLHQLGGFYRGDPGVNALFENRLEQHVADAERRWVTLHFETGRPNRFAVGARVRLIVERPGTEGTTRIIERVVGTGAGFGASSLQLEVGLGDASAIQRIEVRWPNGEWQTFRDVPLDSFVRFEQGKAGAVPLAKDELPIFGTDP